MITGNQLRLLVIEKSKHAAEALAGVLRDAGYSIEYRHVAKTTSLKSQLNRLAPDIVLCGSGNSLPPPKTVLSIIRQHGLTIPVIAIADAAPEDAIVAAHKTGISALVSYDCPEHLQLATGRVAAMLHLEQRQATLEEALHNSENRCLALLENSSEAVACFQGDTLSYANQSYLDLFAISDPDDVANTQLQETISCEQHQQFSNFLDNFLSDDSAASELQINCRNAEGEIFACDVELTPATLGGLPCTQIAIHPENVDTVLEHRIETLSRQDTLTGLNNRKQFMKLLEKCVSNQQEGADQAALIYILIDNFKSIREDIGISASDMILRDIAELIENQNDTGGPVARFGDYVFTLLHRGSSIKESQAFGEKLLRRISAHVSETGGRSISTTGSIGICAITGHTRNAQNVVSRADLACEVARTSGGDQVHIHSTVVDEQLAQDQEQHRDSVIRETIDEDRLSLVFLPIVSLKGASGQRYEVLLRVVDEAGHAILPSEFLSIADKTGYSGEIDRWVINEAFKTLAEQRMKGSNISLYIKLSDATLSDAELPGWINQKLKEYWLVGDSDGVVFEIPEHIAINNLKNAMVFVKTMQKLHCKVALEHFGGSNKARLMKHLPADMIKIDGSLINNLSTNMQNQARVQEIVGQARKYGKLCIAERVDNANDLAMLWQYGIDFIQGNFAQAPSKELSYEFEGAIT